MITTIGSANIYHLVYNKKKRKKKEKNFLFVLRTLGIYSLNNFPIYHSAVLTIIIMLYITSLLLIYLITGHLCLLTAFL